MGRRLSNVIYPLGFCMYFELNFKWLANIQPTFLSWLIYLLMASEEFLVSHL